MLASFPARAMVLPNVVVSTEVLQPAVDAVLKGITRSSVLLTNTQDLHRARLSPSQVQLLETADILIVPDRRLTPTLKNWYAKIEKRGGIILSLTEQEEAKSLIMEGGNNQADPHIWLDPLRMANLMQVVARVIGSYTPEINADLHANAQRWARHMRATLVPNITRMLKAQQGRTGTATIFAAHPAYRYFTERFALSGIRYHTSSGHKKQGARSQLRMIEYVTQLKPDCIIVDSLPNRKMEKLASDIGKPIYAIMPTKLVDSREVTPLPWFESDYDRLIYAIAKRFADCY